MQAKTGLQKTATAIAKLDKPVKTHYTGANKRRLISMESDSSDEDEAAVNISVTCHAY